MCQSCCRSSLTIFVCFVCICLLEFDVAFAGSGVGWGAVSNRARCCEYAYNQRCKSNCKKAKSRDDVGDACLLDQDHYVLNCLEKQEVGARCCSMKASSKCLSACKTVFVKEQSPSESDLRRISDHCTQEVVACVQDYLNSLPVRNMSDSLLCCEEHAGDDICRSKCRRALNTLTKEEDVINEVALYCGNPDLASALWQCFLRQSASGRSEATNVISTRLDCCRKASNSRCRNLCIKNYHLRNLAFTEEFDQKCLYSPLESDLNICLEEVENRCEPGCSNLKYCSNFNNRPELSFRSCNLHADSEARQTVQLWSLGTIMKSSLLNLDIPIKDIGQCESDKWTAIACTMFIKPCHDKSLSGSICRSDCLDVLSKCLDTSRISQSSITAEMICNKLSPQNNSSPCISLSLYSDFRNMRNTGPSEVITPCNPNPCSGSQMCVVNWKSCPLKRQSAKCQPFQCVPGCSLREGVHQIIPLHTFIRVPNASDINCYQACQCGPSGVLRQCKSLGCVREDQCVLSSGMILNHGSVFTRVCTRCVCHSGKVTCTKRFCPALPQRSSNNKLTPHKVVPCRCPVEYAPVCGFNGQTYPSSCLALCAEMKLSETLGGGSCSSRDPCLRAPCLPNERCVVKRQKCLWFRNRNCKQYECIMLKSQCDHHDSTVCDQNGREYRNLCQLLLEKRTLAYRGRCLSYCSSSGIICGVDGDEYTSECAAWANGVVVDYVGHCRSVGNYHEVVVGMPFCPNVSCPSRYLKHCEPIIPPGACCPICAGEIRLLMSESLLESSESYLSSGLLTVADVLDALRLHVKVLQCEIFGYLNVEGDLTILIMPIVTYPSALQIEVCMAETKRLGYLLGTSNPALTTYLALSVFVSADVRTCRVNSLTVRNDAASHIRSLFFVIVAYLLNSCTRPRSV